MGLRLQRVPLLGFVLSLGLLLGGCGQKEGPATPVFSSPQLIQDLYQMMKDFHEVMEGNHEEYWVDGGTALGTFRHGGIIPWDDDLDVCIQVPEGRKDPLAHLRPIFESLGYQLSPAATWAYHLLIQGRPDKPPHMDIFFMTERNGRLYYGNFDGYGRREGDALHYRVDQLHPIQLHSFGPFQVRLASDDYFALYGDWQNYGIQDHLHGPDQLKKAVRIVLTPETRKPAPVMAPLRDRVRDGKVIPGEEKMKWATP